MADETRNLHKIRSPYLNQAKHINDVFLNLGFDYRGKILKSGTSPELWANPLQIPMYNTLEGMIMFLLENAKTIKKWFSIAHSSDTTNIT
jgi:hypothetical protein